MNWPAIAGIAVALFHAVLITVAFVTPFITSSLPLLAAIFLIDLFTVLSWTLFDNKCFLTIIEGKLLGSEKKSFEHMSMAQFNQLLSRWIPPDAVMMFNTLRPYCMMFFTGCKMLPLLAVAAA